MGRWPPPSQLKEKKQRDEFKKQKKEGWPFSILTISFLKGMGRRPHPVLAQGKTSEDMNVRRARRERGMATSIRTVLMGWADDRLHFSFYLLGGGEMATLLSSKRTRKKLIQAETRRETAGHLHAYYSSLRGWIDGHLNFLVSSQEDEVVSQRQGKDTERLS